MKSPKKHSGSEKPSGQGASGKKYSSNENISGRGGENGFGDDRPAGKFRTLFEWNIGEGPSLEDLSGAPSSEAGSQSESESGSQFGPQSGSHPESQSGESTSGKSDTDRVDFNGQTGEQQPVLVRSDFYFHLDPRVRRFVRETITDVAPRDLCWTRSHKIDHFPARKEKHSGVVNLTCLNNIANLETWLIQVNQRLSFGSWHIVCLETGSQRTQRVMRSQPPMVRNLLAGLDRAVQFMLDQLEVVHPPRKGALSVRNRVISLESAMNRLLDAGFEIAGYREIGGLTWIATRKKTWFGAKLGFDQLYKAQNGERLFERGTGGRICVNG